MHARAACPDYDEWAQLGVRGRAWEDVLPFFKRLETDDFSGDSTARKAPSSHRYRAEVERPHQVHSIELRKERHPLHPT